jgi:hypothetical protein
MIVHRRAVARWIAPGWHSWLWWLPPYANWTGGEVKEHHVRGFGFDFCFGVGWSQRRAMRLVAHVGAGLNANGLNTRGAAAWIGWRIGRGEGCCE